jgi:hypothetical protein
MAELVDTYLKQQAIGGGPHTNTHLVSRIYEMPAMKI